jgi:hypothetical protein
VSWIPNPAFFPTIQTFQTFPVTPVLQGLQAGGDILPALEPLSPIISAGYVGQNAYQTFQTTYNSNKDLSPRERWKTTTVKTADVTLLQMLSTFLIPLFLFKKMNPWIEKPLKKAMAKFPKLKKFLEHRWIPSMLKGEKAASAITATVLTALTTILNKPINALANDILDWTYRPLVEKHRREKIRKEQEEWLKKYNELRASQRPVHALRIMYYPPPVIQVKNNPNQEVSQQNLPQGNTATGVQTN